MKNQIKEKITSIDEKIQAETIVYIKASKLKDCELKRRVMDQAVGAIKAMFAIKSELNELVSIEDQMEWSTDEWMAQDKKKREAVVTNYKKEQVKDAIKLLYPGSNDWGFDLETGDIEINGIKLSNGIEGLMNEYWEACKRK